VPSQTIHCSWELYNLVFRNAQGGRKKSVQYARKGKERAAKNSKPLGRSQNNDIPVTLQLTNRRAVTGIGKKTSAHKKSQTLTSLA
jgi:hypothetical protein